MDMWLHKELLDIFHSDNQQQSFEKLMAMQGHIFRKRDGRCTQLITLNERHYFIKQFSSTSWFKLFKSLFFLKFDEISNKLEYLTLKRLKQLNILVPAIYAFGNKPSINPTKKQSFIITESLLDHTISLTDFCNTWKLSPPSFALRNAVIKKIARITKNLHGNGIIHQDLFFHHFLLDNDSVSSQHYSDLKIYLIDFHRAFIRKKPRQRWMIKDLAGLYCSGKFFHSSKRDIFRFLKEYYELPLRTILKTKIQFLNKVIKRGEKNYKTEFAKKQLRLHSTKNL